MSYDLFVCVALSQCCFCTVLFRSHRFHHITRFKPVCACVSEYGVLETLCKTRDSESIGVDELGQTCLKPTYSSRFELSSRRKPIDHFQLGTARKY